jgi:uncharacterized protein with GYD domain
MPKFLVKGSYTSQGAQGLAKAGGSSRVEAVKKMIEGAGGKLEAFYYAFGDTDVYAIVEAPDVATAAAMSMTINASGMVELSLIPLITPAEIDAAAKKTIQYKAPGA